MSFLGDLFLGESGQTAAKDAAALQAQAGQKAGALYDPYIEAGASGLEGYEDLLSGGFNLADFMNEPGFQFRLQQGNQAVQNQAANTRSPYGSAATKAMTRYSQGLASQEYGQAHGRYQNRLGNFMNLAQFGMFGTGGKANALMGIGNAQAAGAVGAAGAKGQGQQNLLQMALMGGAFALSDERLKTDIEPLDGQESLALLQALDPVAFRWNGRDDRSAGVIAQQLQVLAPHLVMDTPVGLQVDYGALIGHLIASVQKLAVRDEMMAKAMRGAHGHTEVDDMALGGAGAMPHAT